MLTLRSIEARRTEDDVVFASHAGPCRSPNNFRRQLREAPAATGIDVHVTIAIGR